MDLSETDCEDGSGCLFPMAVIAVVTWDFWWKT
jgi:hypothetical protein